MAERKRILVILIILALAFPLPAVALTEKEAVVKNEEMLKKYAAGDEEGAYRIFLEISGMIAPSGPAFPQTEAQIKEFQNSLRTQNIEKSTEEIRAFVKEIDLANRKMFKSYMKQDAQGVLAAAQEMENLSKEFVKQKASLPKDVTPETALPKKDPEKPKDKPPVLVPSEKASEQQIAEWEKRLADELAETRYMKQAQKFFGYVRAGLKLSGRLSKYPLVGTIFNGINVPFETLENYQVGDGVFKAFFKSLSGNAIHGATNIFVLPVLYLRRGIDIIFDVPEKERWILDWRTYIVGANNCFWDEGFGLFGGVGEEELKRRNKIGYYDVEK